MTHPLPAHAQLPKGLVDRARMMIRSGGRRLLGIAGTPGAGKSTVAQLLAEALGDQAVVVPMDGFHLANRELARLGRGECKGAPDTFDAPGYIALLQRLKFQQPGETVYAPMFDRALEESLAGAIAVEADVPLVISEGNYLLLSEGPWAPAAQWFDDLWFVAVSPAQRRARLIERHMRYGRSRAEAEAWVEHTDEPNAVRVDADRARAHVMVPWAG
jgi:pantothenate kinase